MSSQITRENPCLQTRGLRALLLYRIGIPVGMLDDLAVAVVDACDQPGSSRDIERAARADGDPPNMSPAVLSTRHDRPDQIAGAKPKVAFLARDVTDWEAVLVRPAHLPDPVAFGCNQQYASARHAQAIRRAGAYAGGIAPVGLVPAEPGAVPLCAAARAGLHGQSR